MKITSVVGFKVGELPKRDSNGFGNAAQRRSFWINEATLDFAQGSSGETRLQAEAVLTVAFS